MHFTILTLFPEAIEPYLQASIVGRAQADKHITAQLVNIRDFAVDKHKTVDDTPYGGGAGMVMKVEPIDMALRSLTTSPQTLSSRVVVLSARGQQFTQAKAQEYAQLDELVLICGRYEGIDQRVADHLADEELSIGPYVLAGGEIAALAVLEATARLIPGVLGNEESLAEESFSQNTEYRIQNIEPRNSKFEILNSSREYPQYTKPADYNGWKVPEILLSGNHEEIRKWRAEQGRTTLPT
jgi:tRNA (guanine37-N1)-methyltransferase